MEFQYPDMRSKRARLHHSESSDEDDLLPPGYAIKHERNVEADPSHELTRPAVQEEEVIVVTDDSDDEFLSDSTLVTTEDYDELAVCELLNLITGQYLAIMRYHVLGSTKLICINIESTL